MRCDAVWIVERRDRRGLRDVVSGLFKGRVTK
jgi:hypothetical protein